MLLFYRKLWPSIVKWSEAIAKGTDYLRVDYFVNACDFQCVASEMNTFPWPESKFFQGFEDTLRTAYLQGLEKHLK